MDDLKLNVNLKPIKDYYAALDMYLHHGIQNEMAVRNAFQQLLTSSARKVGWDFIEEYALTSSNNRTIHVDGAFLDTFHIEHGYWEAKDEKDDLDKEIRAKFERGYPNSNIIFQSPDRAVIFQEKRKVFDESLRTPEMLVHAMHQLFNYRPVAQVDWDKASARFKEDIPRYARALIKTIEQERKINQPFIEAFRDFTALCKQTINPNISTAAIEEMLIQHILTNRLFVKVFNNPDFVQRNAVAREINRVIHALTSRSFTEAEFYAKLDHVYGAIEQRAKTLDSYAKKQHFLNAVYERFFQGFSVKVADTHGIVYTPQPIVDFMVRSVDEILKKEFGKKDGLGAKGVHILDPFVGTGNFIMRIMKEIPKTLLEHKYTRELHCNEVMLLPYYIASMNIEHEFYEQTGAYKPFDGICLVDTFELAEEKQTAMEFMIPENVDRVKKLKETPLFVIIGNPPYNTKQLNENDNNKSRKYPTLDARVSDTYTKSSSATNKQKLSDVYVKAFRWASDQIIMNSEGIVAFVTNNSFIDEIAFDGMRKHLSNDFDKLYIVNLRGNVRKNPKIAGTTHNVFGIQVGVSINILVKHKNEKQKGSVYFVDTDELWRIPDRFRYLNNAESLEELDWSTLTPDGNNTWLTSGLSDDYSSFLPIAQKGLKNAAKNIVFSNYSLGVNTNRDSWAYNSSITTLRDNIKSTIDFYNLHVLRLQRSKEELDIDQFVDYDDVKISWSETMKLYLKRGIYCDFDEAYIRPSLYRPFFKQYLYYDKILNERRYQIPVIFPTATCDHKNLVICIKGIGMATPFYTLITDVIPNLQLTPNGQCFPFYTYNEDGTHRKENITDWALEEYRKRYGSGVGAGSPRPDAGIDATAQGAGTGAGLGAGTAPLREEITKRDIFHYIYGILHSPEYREKYAANLRRELPRIPYVKSPEDFWAFSRAGQRLAWLHLNYDADDVGAGSPRPDAGTVGAGSPRPDAGMDATPTGAGLGAGTAPLRAIPEYPLTHIENPAASLDWRVEKMRWKDRDTKTTLIYNDFLTLTGIPSEAHRYKLGNRSALDWLVDQYQIKTDKRSGIVNDPNRPDDPEYIVRLVKKIVTVSLETMEIVDKLPGLEVE